MVDNVIHLSKVKRRKKIEAMKETFFSPVTLIVAGMSLIAGVGIYGSYFLMDHSEMFSNLMLASFYNF